VVGTRIAWTLGVLVAGVVLAGCATAISGTPIAAANVPVTTPPATTGHGIPPPTSTGTGGDLSKQAQTTCARLPKSAASTAFGLPDVTVTADSGQTLKGGILQVKCVVTSTVGFRANVVVQIYPSTTITTPDQYFQLMAAQFKSVQKLNGINGADVAGILQDTQTGSIVDEAFAAKKDTAANTVNVVIAGVADTPGIAPKLVAFITALASP